MAFRIAIKYKIPDARGDAKLGDFNSLGLWGKVTKVEVVDVYTIDAKLTPKQLQQAAALLTNPLAETASVNRPQPAKNFSYVFEVAFLPGVTDNVGGTAKETIEDGLKLRFRPGESVYSSRVFFVFGKLSSQDAEKISESLYNPLIQRIIAKDYRQFRKDQGFAPNLPKVNIHFNPKADEVDLYVNDEELKLIGSLGIKNKDGSRRGPLALGLLELKTIRGYFHKLGRNPTDVELESLAQTWSEHCKHTIFSDPLDEIKDGIFKHYIKRATQIIRQKKGKEDFCVSVFSDNSGGIVFDQNYLITHKVETHNTPSALDPFGGAVTGIVGVNRDTLGFGLAAKPVINAYGFCLAEPGDDTELYRDEDQQNKLLSSRRIFEGVAAGINAGGNQSGIPTNSGFLCFDDRFRGKPLVFAGTVGLIPRKINNREGHAKQARPGDYIVMVGGRVGLDGIHGATFSSEGLSKNSPATAVQIGDPITQKKFSDAVVKEARGRGLYDSITDNGAGGLSSSVGEMAKEAGGCLVLLHQVPVKYPGLSPWQIWISESQERMTLAVPKTKWTQFQNLMNQRGVETTRIGEFTDSGKCVVKYRNRTVMDVHLDFLHEGRPVKFQQSHKDLTLPIKPPKQNNLDFSQIISRLLSRPNLASFEFLAKQYDHEVQGSSVTKPLQGLGRVNAEATVTRPVLSSQKGVVLSYGINPAYSDINTYHMAACAIDSAVRAAVAAGADLKHLALLDNFCWYSGSHPESLYKLKLAAKACFDYSTLYDTPFISGKDSMFNDFQGFDKNGQPVKISVPPTLLISAIGVIDDVSKAVTLDVKFPGDLVYLLGETKNELGGSEYYALLSKQQGKTFVGNNVPKVNARQNFKLYQAVQQAVEAELIASAIPLSRGGLAAALCKTAIAGNWGVQVTLEKLRGTYKNEEQALFSESQGRILVTVAPRNRRAFEKLLRGNACAKLGVVTKEKIIDLSGKAGKQIASLPLARAAKAYKSTFKDF